MSIFHLWTACLIHVVSGHSANEASGALRTEGLAPASTEDLGLPSSAAGAAAAPSRNPTSLLHHNWSQHLAAAAFGELVDNSAADAGPVLNGRTVVKPFVLAMLCGMGTGIVFAAITWRVSKYAGGSMLFDLLETEKGAKRSVEDEAALEAWAQSVGANSLVYRGALAAFMTTTLIVEFVMSRPAYRYTFFLYLTHWALLLQCIHLIGGVWVTWRIRRATSVAERARILQLPAFTMPIVYPATAMVALGWWTLIFVNLNMPLWFIAKRWPIFWITHGVNAVISFLEVITIRQPLYFGDLYLCIGFCTAYIAFTIVYFYVVKGVEGSGQNHLYDVLDFSSHMIFSVVLVLVVMLIVPFVYYIFVSAASCRKPPLMLGEQQTESQSDSAHVRDEPGSAAQ